MHEMHKSEDIKNNFPYLDILYLEHPTSKNHKRMPMSTRAGQFSPFAALTGFSDEIKETERYTSDEIYLAEEKQEELDRKIQDLNKNQLVEITYFIKDKKKKGGTYRTKTGKIRKLDTYQKQIIFDDNTKINIKDIINIEICR